MISFDNFQRSILILFSLYFSLFLKDLERYADSPEDVGHCFVTWVILDFVFKFQTLIFRSSRQNNFTFITLNIVKIMNRALNY